MKKMAVCSVFFLIAISLFAREKIGLINDDSVRLRKEPTLSGEIIDELMKGTRIKILNHDKVLINEGTEFYVWINIEINGIYGWVYSKYIDTDAIFFFSGVSGKIFPISNWEKNVYAIRDNTILYDSELYPIGKMGKGEKACLVRSDSRYIPDSYNQYYKSSLVLINNKLLRLVVIDYNGMICIVNESSITPYYYTSPDKVIYSRQGFIYKNIPALTNSTELSFLSTCEIIANINFREYLLHELNNKLNDNSIVYEQLVGFIVHNNYLVLNLKCGGGRFYAGGYYAEEIVLYELVNKNLEKVSEDLVYSREH